MEGPQQQLVMNLLAYAVQRDIPAAQLCRLAGIDLAALKKPGKATFTPKQLHDLWLNAAHLANDPLFGLHFGESLQLAALGVVGGIIKSSSTVGEALTHAAALTHFVTDQLQMQIVRAARSFTIRFIPLEPLGKEPPFAFRQFTDMLLVFTIHELDGLLLEKIRPRAVRLPYTVPDVQEYERVLRCRPLKKAGEYAMDFDGKYWDEPILTANYELQSHLLRKAGAVSSAAGDAQALPVRIHNYLLANAYLGIASLEEIAANFHISPRSLQRRLKEEGVRYQELADSVRKSLALHYLESGNYQLKDISYMLGYNELSAFTRAFKRWTGAAPLAYKPGQAAQGRPAGN